MIPKAEGGKGEERAMLNTSLSGEGAETVAATAPANSQDGGEKVKLAVQSHLPS